MPEIPTDSVHVTDFYFCDIGTHAGKYFVELKGYVTENQLRELQGYPPKPKEKGPLKIVPQNERLL